MRRENYFARTIKARLADTRLGKAYRTRLRLKKGKLYPLSQTIDDLFPEMPYVKLLPKLNAVPRVGIQEGITEYMGYNVLTARFPRYKRFLDFNRIPFKSINLHRSDWREQCEDLDIVIADCVSEPSRLNEFQGKIEILERFYDKICYPSAKDRWSYEDKVRVLYQVQELGFEHAKTFVTHDKDEAIAFAETAQYPLISKIKTGSCSRGVDLVKTKKEALRIINKNFGLGRRALWTYSFEKDYVYFQEFFHDATYDLRIFIVGDVIAGYRRRMKGKDFRASGGGLLDRALFPQKEIDIALRLKEKWDATILAVDFVDTNNSQDHKIIEVSISFGLDYPEYLEKDGKRVFYQITDEGIVLREGCFWAQDFIIVELLRKWQNKQQGKQDESDVRLGWELHYRD